MNILNYLLIAVIILIVDLPWLLAGSKFSKSMIRSIQGSDLEVRYLPSIVVYLALAYLVCLPKSLSEAFLLGLCVYAVYDFTNFATLKNYSFRFAVLDSIWGGILFVIVHSIIEHFKLNK